MKDELCRILKEAHQILSNLSDDAVKLERQLIRLRELFFALWVQHQTEELGRLHDLAATALSLTGSRRGWHLLQGYVSNMHVILHTLMAQCQ
ncbi:MAG: hypothetical protein QXS00_08045 [Pyrobaculum sp.]